MLSEIFNLNSYSYNLPALPYLVFGLICLFFSVFIWLARRRSLVNIGYALMCFNIFLWMFFDGISLSTITLEMKGFWAIIATSGAMLISVSTYCFSVGWLGDQRQKKFILPFYVSMLPFVILLWSSDLIIKEVRLVKYFLGYPLYWHYGGEYFLIFLCWWLIPVVLALYNICKAIRVKDLSLLELKRRKMVLYIFFFGYLGVVDWLPVLGLKIFSFGCIPTFLMVVGLAFYGILKYQLFNIKLIIKKTLIYSCLIALIAGLIVAVSFLSNWFTQNIPGFQFWMVPLMAGIATFIVGNLFWKKSKEADNLKYEFIRVAAHKLRTPITQAKWAIERLLEIAKTKEEKKLVRQINNSNEQLIKLSDVLLNASREEYEALYKLSPVSLEEIYRETLSDFQTQIDVKKIEIIFNTDKNLPKINTDEEKIGAVVQALLDNAVTYTPKEGKIQISIEQQKNNLVFSVKDNGIGILKEEEPYIFSRFFRSRRAELMQTEGLGLGLFLVKNIVAGLGGKIGFESGGENKGSKFWFNLPL